MRRAAASFTFGVLLSIVAVVAGTAGAAGRVPCLHPPVLAPVIDPFRAPPCPYCAGNRGIEYTTTPGTPIVAAASGTVSFAGTVADVRYVVVEHAEGHRTTYGRLDRIDTSVGRAVVAGEVLGRTTDRFFFGLRSGADYLDPQPRLAVFVARPQLVPLDGTARREGRPPRLQCP